MSSVHLHLLVNHIPILGAAFVLLLLLWGLLARSRDLTRAALWLALPLFIAGFVADRTGDAASERIESLSWVDRSQVHEHEERAEAVVIVLGATAVLAAFALWRGRTRPEERWPAGLAAVAVFVALLLGAWTGLAGGQIRHDEIRPGAVLPPPGPDRD
jgi:heme A synthase